MLLEADGMHVSYGQVPAVRGIDLQIGEGEAVALLGRNGAGKTTTLRALAGLMPVEAGHIRFEGADVSAVPAKQRVRLGIALVPEGRGVFPELTVRENLTLGAYHRRLKPAELAAEIERTTATFEVLTKRLDQSAGSLSGGEQQMLAVGRGMMSAPRILLVDEPSLGLAPVIVERLYELMASLRQAGMSIVVVEQYVEMALEFADRAYVLDKGRVAVSGTAQELSASTELVEAYLSDHQEVAL